MEVHLLDYTSGRRQVAGVVRLVGDIAVIEGDMPGPIREEMERGVVAGPRNKRVYLTDGAAFLRALPLAYSGSYFRAELVQ